jgi:hypothetical protein
MFSFLLKMSGVLSIAISAILAFFAMNVYFERSNYGSGLMFADAELFMILVIIFLFIGVACLLISKKLKS